MEQRQVEIISNRQLGPDMYRMDLAASGVATDAAPGQFVMVQANDGGVDPLLRRPFSIHAVTKEGGLQIAYKVLGKGTQCLRRKRAGDVIDIVGPLGQGYLLEDTEHFIVGGGMGIAPMKFLAERIAAQFGTDKLHFLLGARNKEELSAFESFYLAYPDIDLKLATDDGSLGIRGLVTALLADAGAIFGSGKRMVYCCGPHPMMKAVALMARELGWQCQVSLETMMACGIKACLGCTVESTRPNSKGGNYLHVCQDGPVFNGEDIKW